MNKIKKDFEELFLDGRYGGRIMMRNLVKGYTKPAKIKDIWKFFEPKLKQAKEEGKQEILDKWETAIYYSENIKGRLDLKVMQNHFKGAK